MIELKNWWVGIKQQSLTHLQILQVFKVKHCISFFIFFFTWKWKLIEHDMYINNTYIHVYKTNHIFCINIIRLFIHALYIYNIGLLTVNIEFIWRGWETGWKTSFSESFSPFRTESNKFYIYRQQTNIVFILQSTMS